MSVHGTRLGLSPVRCESPALPNLRCVSSSKIVKYVISAEFDNRIGSVIKHQIPRKIPGFKENLQNLAELMIPLNTEKKDNEDYSIFLLYKDSTKKYRSFPDIDIDLYGSMSELQRLNIHEIGTIYESPQIYDDEEVEEDESISEEEENDDILFFLCVNKTIRTNTDERGAKIRSIAIGTPLRNFIVFKHLITITIQSYIIDGSIAHLIALFNVINTTDLSIWQKYISLNHQLYQNLSLSYDFNNRLILSNFKNLSTKDIVTQSVKYKNGILQYFSSLETEDINSLKLKLIPLNFSLSLSKNEIKSDLNLNFKILNFFKKLSLVLNQVSYKNFNILIYSNNLINSTDSLCQFILSISNFLNGFDNTYFSNDKILYFPLIDLSNWENLLEFDKTSKNTKIIGTNNIILKDSAVDFYDFWYDFDNETLEVSENLKIIDTRLTLNKTYYFQELLDELILGKHDSNTVLLSLKKFNIWQIIKILKRDLTNDDDDELNIKDYYLKDNKNLIIFNEFFEFKTIELFEKIDLFLTISSNENILNKIYELSLIYKYFIQFISINDQNIGKFLFILEIYPINTTNSTIKDLLFDVENIQLNKNQNSLINLIFKFILIKNSELQTLIHKLFETFNKSSFKLILDQRLNIFTKLLIEEYSSSSNTKNIIKKKTKTEKSRTRTAKNKALENYI